MPLLVVHLGALHLLQCVLSCQGGRRIVDPCNIPALVTIFGLHNAFSPEVFDKFGQTRPLRSVHMGMVTIRDVLLIHLVGSDPAGTKASAEQLYKLFLEGSAEIVDHLLCTSRGCDGVHLSEMRFRFEVAAVSILVSACFLTDLAVEA